MAERQCYNLIKCCLRGVAKQRVVTFITSYNCNAGKKNSQFLDCSHLSLTKWPSSFPFDLVIFKICLRLVCQC